MSEAGLTSIVREIDRYYGDRLLAIALFGSRVGSRARAESDWDLLLVMSGAEPIRSRLYREWSEELAPRLEPWLAGISPHFVHLPDPGIESSSLWLEIALASVVLRDPTGRLADHLARVRASIDAGEVERREVHGLPYWVHARVASVVGS